MFEAKASHLLVPFTEMLEKLANQACHTGFNQFKSKAISYEHLKPENYTQDFMSAVHAVKALIQESLRTTMPV